jgi:hypothetical protein
MGSQQEIPLLLSAKTGRLTLCTHIFQKITCIAPRHLRRCPYDTFGSGLTNKNKCLIQKFKTIVLNGGFRC